LNFKILIIGNRDRFIHLEKFATEINKKGIETKLIYDFDFIDKFFELNIKKKIEKNRNFKKLLEDFNPNIVLLDRISKIGKKVIENNIPLWILLRGNYWEEAKWARKTIYKSKKQIISAKKNEELIDYCFENSNLILPISRYLENEVKQRYPNKNIVYFPADGRNPDEWKKVVTQKLKHPCVGLIQGMNVWGKTKELLILKKVMMNLPNVTFYLAGDGRYRKNIIPELIQHKNFVWLNNLEYPNEIRKFFSEIDIFLLLSGLEGLGQTIIESLLMKKPTIASDIGGIPELIQHNKTGLLVKNGDAENISENILKLINNPSYAQEIAESGYQIIKKEFSWNRLSEKFSEIIYNYKRDYAK